MQINMCMAMLLIGYVVFPPLSQTRIGHLGRKCKGLYSDVQTPEECLAAGAYYAEA